ncbi:tyrosine-type recombinase/integrase [Pseudovibrio brasiliensis]|uniref:Site-specific integrase n=1 Tax=Pseudovibrio brasiliensis TaxID=1898042 RepID=A0ABX8AK42_9HYPH|nr:site-specific integrase [Pseudovibrio brasiliensis]QUS54069.1 site-specific integrase [Pseudovibrio brasiliensis]
MPNLTKRTVDAAKPTSKKHFLWDSKLKGFGLQVMPSGAKTLVVQYRTHEGRSRRMSLGKYGELTPDQARGLATNVLATVRNGDDPLLKRENKRIAPTVNVLLDVYMSKHVQVHNKPKTMKDIERLLRRCVRSRLGHMKLSSVRRQDIAKLHHALRATPRQANQVLAVLSKAFNLAEVWGLRPEHSNPVRLVKRYKENERDRFLSEEELQRLGRTLELADQEGLPWIIKAGKRTAKHLPKDAAKRKTPVNPRALCCLRLLFYTGARLSEIATLKWKHIDFELATFALPSRKGDERKPHPVSSSAIEILSEFPRVDGSPYVLPGCKDPTQPISIEVIENAWQRIRIHANIPDVRIHDLRHTVGTFAAQAGSNAFLISHLLRHRNVTITNRYVNHDAHPIRVLSEAIGERIEAGLQGEE